jgi:hypothetical protein
MHLFSFRSPPYNAIDALSSVDGMLPAIEFLLNMAASMGSMYLPIARNKGEAWAQKAKTEADEAKVRATKTLT